MNILTKALSNISYITISNFSEKALLFILFISIARELGPNYFGQFLLAFTFCNVVFIFNEFGLTATVNRNVAANKKLASIFLDNFLTFRIVSSLIIFLLLILTVRFLNFSSNLTNLIYILSIYFIFSYLSHPFVAVFRAFEKMKYIFILTIIDRGVVVFLSISLMLFGAGLIYIGWCFVLGSLLRIFCAVFLLKKQMHLAPSINLDFSFMGNLLKDSLVIGIFMIFTLLCLRVDTLILYFYDYNDFIIGYFNAAQVIFTVLLLPATSFAQATFPMFSRIHVKKSKNISRYKIFSYLGLFFVVVFISIIFYFFPRFFIELIYGSGYQDSIDILRIFVLAVPIFSINILTQWLLISANKEFSALLLTAIATILNIVLNFLFIPEYGAEGAAWTTLAAQITIFIIGLSVYFSRSGRKLFE